MNKLIVFFFFLAGCGIGNIEGGCNYFIADICFQSGWPVDSDQAEGIIALMDEELAIHYSDNDSMSGVLARDNVNVVVRMTDEALAINCELIKTDMSTSGHKVYSCEKLINGINWYNDLILMNYYTSCLTFTTFAHELLHSYERHELGGNPKVLHSTPWFFDEYLDINEDAERMDIVEIAVRSRAREDDLCGDMEVW